ncbi:MAG: PEP-CTERM sorting domain-containing protein [Phycisphaerales bacterium]|nr:PEP-CTERM sorting domain-containing protein [Phycisphaerales bacterium]
MLKMCVCVAALVVGASGASGIVYSGSSGSLAASAEFTTSGTQLRVYLSNTSTADIIVPADVLTAVFFEISGSPIALTRVSALLGPGSVVTNGTTPGDGVVGGEWASGFKATGYPGGFRYGISSSGLGDFGPGDRFPGPDLAPPASPNGLQFGIASAGDNPATHNGGANTPLIQNEVRFTLDGLPTDFDLNRITGVRFVYGTAYGEGQFDVPAPGTLALLGLGGLVAGRRRR